MVMIDWADHFEYTGRGFTANTAVWPVVISSAVEQISLLAPALSAAADVGAVFKCLPVDGHVSHLCLYRYARSPMVTANRVT